MREHAVLAGEGEGRGGHFFRDNGIQRWTVMVHGNGEYRSGGEGGGCLANAAQVRNRLVNGTEGPLLSSVQDRPPFGSGGYLARQSEGRAEAEQDVHLVSA